MTAKTEPRSGLKNQWDPGEAGWNIGMDANLLSIGWFAYHLSVKNRDASRGPCCTPHCGGGGKPGRGGGKADASPAWG